MKPATSPPTPRRAAGRSMGQGAVVGPLDHGAAWLIALAALLAACVQPPDAPDPNVVSHFEVRVVDGTATGTPDDPLPFSTELTPIALEIRAISRAGNVVESDIPVTLEVVPGRIASGPRELVLADGRATVELGVQFTFGETRVWIRESGDDSAYALGVSPRFHFAEPRIRNVRFNPLNPAGLSPLMGREARISEGVLMVTNIVSNGFYAADIGDRVPTDLPPGTVTEVEQEPFESLFVFTFNFPEGIAIGDRLCTLAGGVAEFQGQTQLTFPNYIIQGVGRVGESPDEGFLDPADPGAPGRCAHRPGVDGSLLAVQPVTLPAQILGDNTDIRAWDSSLVRIENLAWSNRFDDCDFDGSGQIEGVDERACRSRCQRDLDCTEMSSLREFDQFSASTGGVAIEIADAGRAAGINPLDGCTRHTGVPGNPDDPPGYRCPPTGRRLAALTGTLRLVDLGGFLLKVVIPRFDRDFDFAP